MHMKRSITCALLAAALFGASTPFAKVLVGDVSPILLAGLLYLGSGIGLSGARLIRDRGWSSPGLSRSAWPWLWGAVTFGGILGPIALMFGLTRTTGSAASLLLNLEAVLTSLIAWVVFRENAGWRMVFGMVTIVAGGIVLSWPSGNVESRDLFGPVMVAAASLCWAIDNNLTRRVSASDVLFVAGSKGLIAGSVNTALALWLGAALPGAAAALPALALGLFGYGVSLVLFVLALRGLGAARTGAYFSTSPFFGAGVAIALLGEQTSAAFWLAAALMACGVWLHFTERHGHEHAHEAEEHTHPHRHDEHHQHAHDPAWDGDQAHSHPHRHTVFTHTHRHVPDIHHRHGH